MEGNKMKMNRFIYSIAALALLATSCDKFLDVMPDNRTELNTQEKIRTFLTSAYPEISYMFLAEFSSDNVDDYGENNPNYDRFVSQVYHWEDLTETDNEDTENLWGETYIAIAASNQAIEAINGLGGADAAGMQAEMAEALLTRAYSHFILVNMFAQAYSKETAATDPGITYMLQPEQGLNPKYERNTVAEVYDFIDKDLQAALPYVSDGYYTVPKYHFNKRAAYAFATRFYLFYERWDEAIKWADACLGEQPGSILRDWKDMSKLAQDEDVVKNHYIDATLSSNVMLMTAYSMMGACFEGRWSYYSRYSHGQYLATNETGVALASLLGSENSSFYYSPMHTYAATNHDKVVFWKIPYLFEYTDPVAQVGYAHVVYPAFTTDMTLLERAEAKILKKQYDSAVKDINIWLGNISKLNKTYTAEQIVAAMKKISYSTWNASTPKKKLNPGFEIGEDGSIQESLLQFVLLLKRIEGLHLGQRWFDVNRYGIEIERRVINMDGVPAEFVDKLTVRDPRRALQIPLKVVDAGYEANKR